VFRIFTLLAAAFAALLSVPLHADPADIAAASRSVVRVVLVADDGSSELIGHGSGIAVGPDLIVTNAHVVEPAQDFDAVRIGVVPPQGKTGWFARVIAFSPRNDLALLKLTEPGTLPVGRSIPALLLMALTFSPLAIRRTSILPKASTFPR